MTPGQENKQAPAQDDLLARCAEILEWQRTGVLRGDALHNFAARQPYGGDYNRLQLAEADTAREAYQFVVQAEQQPVGVVLPPQCTDKSEHVKYRKGWNSCLSEIFRLNRAAMTVKGGEA